MWCIAQASCQEEKMTHGKIWQGFQERFWPTTFRYKEPLILIAEKHSIQFNVHWMVAAE